MDRSYYESELRDLQSLYSKVEKISEEKAQQLMNCDDDKNTILMYIQEDMDEIEEKLEELDREEEYTGGYDVDPAFRSWAEFYAMVV